MGDKASQAMSVDQIADAIPSRAASSSSELAPKGEGKGSLHADSIEGPLPPGKGKGKIGKGAPVPPPAAKGKGKGKSPPTIPDTHTPKGKGKGKSPPPIPKGKGKSSSTSAAYITEPVPSSLVAPGPQRIHVPQRRQQGSIWDTLRPWDGNSRNVLECLSIDVDEIMDMWTPPPQPVTLAPVIRLPLEYRAMQRLEVAIRGTNLTPDLVQQGLTQDFDVLSEDQATALYDVVVPAHALVRGTLHGMVGRDGIESLTSNERVLWTIESIPQALQLAQFAVARFSVPESIDSACTRILELGTLVDELCISRSVKTLLQTCLVYTNVLSQQGRNGLSVQELPQLQLRKLHPNSPSVLTLVARSLQRQHDARCRLRFTRMIAVGQHPIGASIKKVIWQYLNDLQESPWDVFQTLKKCKMHNLSDYADNLLRQKASLSVISAVIQDFNVVSANQLATGMSKSRIPDQVLGLREVLRDAFHKLEVCEIGLPRMANDLIDLFGQGRAADLQDVTVLLHCLEVLGRNLETEKETVDRKRRSAQGSGKRGQKWGTWEEVDTKSMVLARSSDPDFIRASRVHIEGAEVLAARQHSLQPLEHLLHGGPDGQFKRCDLTGRWLPVGHAAAAAARDRDSRGATAGFFLTY